MKRKKFSYPRHQRTSIRWARVFSVAILICILVLGGWWFTRPEPAPAQAPAAVPERQEMVLHEGKWLLPGEIPQEKRPDPVIDAELAKAIQAREKQKKDALTNATMPEQPQISIIPTKQNPYAGKSLAQVTADIATNKYIAKGPLEWGEHIAGVTSYLSHVWGARNMPQQQRFGALPQPTAKADAKAPATIALTLDACGGKTGSAYDAELIDFLRQQRIPATLFVTSTWLKKNEMLAKILARDPLFEIAAHGSRHKPSSIDGREAYGIKGTASLAELVREVEGNARDIEAATGLRPKWFRSGTAFYDDISVAVIRQLGFGIAGYSIAGDAGATLSAEKVAERVLAAQDGDILLLHMNKPQSGTREGLKQALPILLERGFVFVHLSQ